MSVGTPSSPSFLTLPLLVLFLGMGLATGLSFNGALSLDAMVFDKVVSSNKHHVLVRFDKSDTDGSNEMNFGELVEASQKLKNLLLTHVDIESDEEASDKLDLAKKYGADKFPTYVLFSDGKEVSKYHDGKEVTDISDLIKWLEDNGIHLALKGRTLPLLDRLVQEYFSSDSSERKAELLKEVKASSDQYKEHDLAKFYPTILEKVSAKGDEYCAKELTRITSMLDKTKDSINEDKREEMRGKTQEHAMVKMRTALEAFVLVLGFFSFDPEQLSLLSISIRLIAAQRRASCKFGGEGESYSSSQTRSAAGHPPPAAAASGLLTRTKSLPSASMLPSDDDGPRDAEHSAKYVRGYTGSFAGAWINRGIGIEEFYTPHTPAYRLYLSNWQP
ncbi:endoplasmic reticulum protein 29 [Perkinsus olseni]|uniref:Endoplasmic reticulum protein 29 n=1 Tax=Perkinsus olseni TaxID=32597 RepID=A0A7J6TMR7_PEROL|nr:endoplasmic reticulum protein 29 [Perkinsus olseni]